MSSEALMLVHGLLLILAIYAHKAEAQVWASKAKTGIRKEHKGKLYFVIEDGDHEALNNVNKWFET